MDFLQEKKSILLKKHCTSYTTIYIVYITAFLTQDAFYFRISIFKYDKLN